MNDERVADFRGPLVAQAFRRLPLRPRGCSPEGLRYVNSATHANARQQGGIQMAPRLLGIVLTALMAASASAQEPAVYDSKDAGVALPQPTRQVKAQYTAEAMRQMIEGDVLLSVVIKADG